MGKFAASLITSGKEALLSQGCSKHEWSLAVEAAAEDEKLRESALYGVKASLVENGLILYMHTIVGGKCFTMASCKENATCE